MQCTNPDNYDKHGNYKIHCFPCGKCLPCRVRYRREWASRIILEARLWHNSLFFTLTYNEENLPDDGYLSKTHIRNFIQNFTRSNHAPRYFICGEYGTLNGRPHYHGIFFGEDPKLTLQDGHLRDMRFQKAWNKGFTDVREFNSSDHQKSVATYVAGYVLKGSWKTEPTLHTSKKEWALQSINPAIGDGAAEKIASALTTQHGAKIIGKLGTAPARFKYGGRSWIMPYRIRKLICNLLDIPFKPLVETIQLDIETGKINQYGPKIKTLAEATAEEKRLKARITRPKKTLD